MNQCEDIKLLLEKYFEGNTSLSEEESLRNYFMSDMVADNLLKYKPIFVFFAESRENNAIEYSAEHIAIPVNRKRVIIRALTTVAACGLILLGIFLLPKGQNTAIPDLSCSGTYIMIEGECFNDPDLVFLHAEQTLNDLSLLFENFSTSDSPAVELNE
ncbi:MAG: hypothetical protein LBH92_02870 [Bacteroidales bacterium]|jgi:hypothetical protein|nr:hypothetical protein [Bacteroidales bacterium]